MYTVERQASHRNHRGHGLTASDLKIHKANPLEHVQLWKHWE